MIRNYLILFLFLLPVFSSGQSDLLRQAVDELKNDPLMKKGRWGLSVVNCTTGEKVEEYNSDSLFIPASIVKLTSTSSALENLSDTFRFMTSVYTTGQVDDQGVLHGDINIIGGADPTIGYPVFIKNLFIDSLYNALQKQGIKSIEGNINGYAGIFDSLLIPDTYADDDCGNYYGAGTAGLIWDGNCMTLKFNTPWTAGAKTTFVSAFPTFEMLKLDNRTTTGKSGTDETSIIWGKPFDFSRMIDGTLPLGKNGYEVYGSSPDPALGFAIAIRWFLAEKGIPVTGVCKGYYQNVNATGKPLLTYYSPILRDIVEYTNTRSYNLSAETCLKMSGLKKYGTGSYESGLKAVYDLLAEASINQDRIRLFDGSGLSKADAVAPGAMTDFLMYIRNKPWFGTLYSSLPIAGETGTLKSMFEGSPVKSKLRAKSGYMKTVRAYAGYVPNAKGETMAFCIIVNNYAGNAYALRKKLEKVMENISLAE